MPNQKHLVYTIQNERKRYSFMANYCWIKHDYNLNDMKTLKVRYETNGQRRR